MTSNIASCTNPNLSWAANSKSQSPCQIASILGGVCFAGVYDVPSLAGNQSFYLGPGDAASDCECNTVRYSILSACAACQSKDWLPWPQYSTNCKKVFVGDFPVAIPPSTVIPHYAFLPLGSDNRWNLTAAQAVGDAPESAGVPQVTVTLTPSGADAFSTVTVTAQPTVTITPSASAGASNGSSNASFTTKSSHAGAIAGGVVGGLAVLGLLLALLFWIYRRTKANEEGGYNKAMKTGSSGSSAPISAFNTKVYDPSDPTTFPPSTPGGFSTTRATEGSYRGQPEV